MWLEKDKEIPRGLLLKSRDTAYSKQMPSHVVITPTITKKLGFVIYQDITVVMDLRGARRYMFFNIHITISHPTQHARDL